MNYINNWITKLSAPLGAGDTVLPIPPDAAARLTLTDGGKYWLTLANSLNPLEQTQWEIVEVSAGLSLVRGRDGTSAHSWSADTLVYCALTAGQLTDLQARITALETGGSTDGALTDQLGNTLTDENSNILIGA